MFHQLPQYDDADDLHPAAGRAGAAADQHQHQEDLAGQGGEVITGDVARGEARRAGNGDDLEQAVAEALVQGAVAH